MREHTTNTVDSLCNSSYSTERPVNFHVGWRWYVSATKIASHRYLFPLKVVWRFSNVQREFSPIFPNGDYVFCHWYIFPCIIYNCFIYGNEIFSTMLFKDILIALKREKRERFYKNLSSIIFPTTARPPFLYSWTSFTQSVQSMQTFPGYVHPKSYPDNTCTSLSHIFFQCLLLPSIHPIFLKTSNKNPYWIFTHHIPREI